MCKPRLIINALALIAAFSCLTAITQAQSSRTWVSGVGDDNNACSRSAPCRTFAGAIFKTTINGEINCLDPAGYGALTITKSITIDCEDTQGAILAGLVNAVVVNLGPSNSNDPHRMVRLRGLTMNGQGTGIRGISVVDSNTAPTTLHVDQVVIDGFTSDGIFFNAFGGELLVRNSVIQDCGANGVRANNSTPGAVIQATLEGSTFAHNLRGILAESYTHMTVSNCNISNNSADGAFAQPADPFGVSELNLYSCVIAHNGQVGVVSNGLFGPTTVRLTSNHIVNNLVVGIKAVNGGLMRSRGNNTVSANPTNVEGTVENMVGQ